jgi:hypothetical protein
MPETTQAPVEIPAKWTEVKELRARYGGRDGRAINKHSRKIFHWPNVGWFELDRNLSGCPPFFELLELRRDPRENHETYFPPKVNVGGKEYWGGGLSWFEAEKLAMEAIRERIT